MISVNLSVLLSLSVSVSPCPISPHSPFSVSLLHFLSLSFSVSVALSTPKSVSLCPSLSVLFEYHSVDPCPSPPTLQPSLISQNPISGGNVGEEASRMRSPSRRQCFISLQKGCKFFLSLSAGRDLSYQVSEAGKHRRRQTGRPSPRVRLE